MNRFDDIMAAISFAEEGDFGQAREFMKGRDSILLAISDICFDANVLKYALNLSRRIKANIDIVYLTRVEAHIGHIEDFIKTALKDEIICRLFKKEGCMKKAILEFTAKRRDIIFVVVGSTPELDIECRTGEKSLSDAWKRLQCPLVVVAKPTPSIA
ncbi:MAG: hypothetical protein HZB33_04965 [Nitrospirae bacterium]|nr:hypothetical protein [Nitrospirota bacterium]